jgi:predicted amidohydrolase
MRSPISLGGADALLFPIAWPEPFGLVMIEAMACGTPVIAYDCGSVPEVIEDGLTGFIVRGRGRSGRRRATPGDRSAAVGPPPVRDPKFSATPWPVATWTSTIAWKKRRRRHG